MSWGLTIAESCASHAAKKHEAAPLQRHPRGGACCFLIYDAACPLCVRISRFLKRWDSANRIQLLPLTSEQAQRLLAAHRLSPDQQRGTFHFISRQAFLVSGEQAVAVILRELPGGRLAAWCLTSLPGHQRLLKGLYQWLATAHGEEE